MTDSKWHHKTKFYADPDRVSYHRNFVYLRAT